MTSGKTLSISIRSYSLSKPAYSLDSLNANAFYQILSTKIDKTYFTGTTHTGTVTIDYTPSDGILSGEFAFDAVSSTGEIIHVTEGRFDIAATK